jgi:hypothetical protein
MSGRGTDWAAWAAAAAGAEEDVTLPLLPNSVALGAAAARAVDGAGSGAAGAAGTGGAGASGHPDTAAVAAADAGADAGAASVTGWRAAALAAAARDCAVPHQGQKLTGRGAGRAQSGLMQR